MKPIDNYLIKVYEYGGRCPRCLRGVDVYMHISNCVSCGCCSDFKNFRPYIMGSNIYKCQRGGSIFRMPHD